MDEVLSEYETIWEAAGPPHPVIPLTLDELGSFIRGSVLKLAAS